MTKGIEILAPCGSMASFEAAVNAGADACYLAGNRFGARAYAENFDEKTLCNVIDKAHLKGVKVYLTVNTLFKNAEIKELTRYLKPLYETGLDAVIVQDLGVFDVIKENFPGLSLHASTQMNICSAEGAKLLKDLGADRIIPARELTLDEIISIKKKVDTEVEVFVHGAMCYCYSGRCLMSSMIGDRSGNRGRCAQPCRRLYNGQYLMSMKDMCALGYVPQLIDAGIDSLKIEGRMKGAYYTAAVVDAYRQMADDHISGCFSMDKCEKYIERLSETFSRGGFCKGYYEKEHLDQMIDKDFNGHKGLMVGKVISAGHGKVEIEAVKDIGVRDILTIDIGRDTVEITSNTAVKAGRKVSFNAASTGKIQKSSLVHRKINNSLKESVENELIKKEKLMPLDIEFTMKNGENLSISVASSGKAVSLQGNIVSKAEKRAIGDKEIKDKLKGLGDSGYYLNTLKIDNDGDSFVSFGEIKNLRREAIRMLDEEILGDHRRKPVDIAGAADNDTNDAEKISEDTIIADYTEDNIVIAYCIEDNVSISDNVKKKLIINLEKPEVVNYISNILDSDKELVDALKQKYDLIFMINADMYTINILCELSRYFSDFGKTAAAFPYIHREEDEAYFTTLINDLMSIRSSCIDALYIRNIDDLAMILNNKNKYDKDIILAASLYAYNDRAAEFYYSHLKDKFNTISFEYPHELTATELKGLSFPAEAGRAVYIYGQENLMITAQKPDKKSKGFIKDERNGTFKYVKNNSLCYNRLLDERVTLIEPDRLDDDELKYGSLIICLHNESEADIYDILKGVLSGSFKNINKNKTTDGHYSRPIL
ncbi:MAG: U32 family peptidase [Eubacterium sp.]|nr:U32 family peptidase [Eubacterium sp.]